MKRHFPYRDLWAATIAASWAQTGSRLSLLELFENSQTLFPAGRSPSRNFVAGSPAALTETAVAIQYANTDTG